MDDKQRVLITGAAGFLGSHLCDRFIDAGYSVVAMDNLVTGDLRNIEHLFGRADFEFVHHDVSQYVHVPGDLFAILHFASPASPADYLRMPIQTLKSSSLGTHNLLGLARTKKARLLIASTSEIYGSPTVSPQSEEYWGNVNPVGPRGVYDEGKRFSEALVMAYHQIHKLDTRIARLFNTYGPRMRLNDGRAMPTFLQQAIAGEPLSVYGDGTQTRSFCYVDDTVEAIYRLLHSDYHLPVNIGNPDEVTILEIAKEILTLTGRAFDEGAIAFRPLPQDDPLQRKPDISRAKAVLDWEPEIPRQDGLARTYQYFVDQMEKNTKHA